MPSLQDLKSRIGSVKNTQKITKAMKMVAAAKLRRAQEHAEAARPYSERMETIVSSLASSVAGSDSAPYLLAGTGGDANHLIIVATADRGLCGGFNSSIVRATRKRITQLVNEGKSVKLFCIGRKGYEQLKLEHGNKVVGRINDMTKKKMTYEDALNTANQILEKLESEKIDVCTIVYNTFKSAITQIVTFQQLVPLELNADDTATSSDAQYEYEPDEEAILEDLLPRNFTIQCFRALLENSASEQGARMSAMDSATRNAGEMIDKLTLQYNRSRQAAITKELIEIISGAEAV